MNNCCVNCFEDQCIRDFIKENHIVGICNYCMSEDVGVSEVSDVGEFVREGLERAYEDVQNLGFGGDFDPTSLGDTVDEIIWDQAVVSDYVFSNNTEDALVKDLIGLSGPSDRAISKGDFDWLDGGGALLILRNEFYGADASSYQGSWDGFKELVKHHARFFDFKNNDSREVLLKRIAEFFPKMTSTIPKGIELYRTRISSGPLSDDPLDLQTQLGPPPVTHALHSRMSPPGISYFYLSNDVETCLAEIRPLVGSTVWATKFVSKNDLMIIDFTRLPEVEVPSIFSEEFDHNLRWAVEFFDGFLTEISKPSNNRDDLIDYVPTQVLAEYLRTQGIDGVKYKSSQFNAGENYTFFCSPDWEYGGGYYPRRPVFHEWFFLSNVKILEIQSQKFEVQETKMSSFSEGEVTVKNNGDF